MTLAYSVVIPAFNAAATIREAIGSILEQTVQPEAIFVVDDGSADRTGPVASEASPLVAVIRKANGGPGSATSAGVRRVRTPVFATLDADDLWLPPKMERQLAVLEADEGVAAVFALGRLFRAGEGSAPGIEDAVTRLWTRTTMVFRTHAAQQVGDFLDFPGYLGELVDWLARSRDLGHRHVMLEEVLALRRVAPGTLSDTGTSDRARGYLHAAFRALERRKRLASDSSSGAA